MQNTLSAAHNPSLNCIISLTNAYLCFVVIEIDQITRYRTVNAETQIHVIALKVK